MKKIIVGTLIATFLVSNSSLAFADTINPSIGNQDINISQVQGDRHKREIPNFYKEQFEGYNEVTLTYSQLEQLEKEYQKSATNTKYVIKLASIVGGVLLGTKVKIPGVKAEYQPTVGGIVGGMAGFTDFIKPYAETIANRIHDELVRSNKNASINVKLHYRAIVVHYQYGSSPSQVESCSVNDITFD